ncbi:hypothetical protein ILUMI_18384 [Ignelater luminosus]|uniref:Uncharacterized protein n=1 Tax=Ignelater luminosus TaxID=2038154 RepID=A0A8K0G6F8_IGNLU|nr:hypothetical protein ILUMI_18384 [Ignelater luminosus]
MVFPRKNFKAHMLTGAPSGTLDLAQPTEWTTGKLFANNVPHEHWLQLIAPRLREETKKWWKKARRSLKV